MCLQSIAHRHKEYAVQIEVWRCLPLLRPRKIGGSLGIFIDRGRAYATWKPRPLSAPSASRVPASDLLANWALNATRQACSYVGQQPAYSQWGNEGYLVKAGSSGEDSITLVTCHECGYSVPPMAGNPRFNNALTGVATDGDVTHPECTLLRASSRTARVVSADWDQDHECLTSSRLSGRLLVAVGSGKSSDRALAFLGAEVVARHQACSILLATQ